MRPRGPPLSRREVRHRGRIGLVIVVVVQRVQMLLPFALFEGRVSLDKCDLENPGHYIII